MMKSRYIRVTAFILSLILTVAMFTGCSAPVEEKGWCFSLEDIPAFSGEPYVVLNGNEPLFTPEELTVDPYEYYSPLDALGRNGYVVACVGQELMPTEERGSIGQVKPSG